MKLSPEIVLRCGPPAGILCLAALLAACSGPIVSRSPEALYARAQEQITNGRYLPAVDSLSRAIEEAPDTLIGRRAQLLRLVLLGGMARAYQDMAEIYLEGHQRAGEAPHATRMRSMALDYFGQVRGLGTDFLEALDSGEQEYLADPLRLGFDPPQVEDGSATLDRVREGNWLEEEERERAQRERFAQGLADMLKLLAGNRPLTPELEFEPAAVAVGTARHLLQLSAAFGPAALDDPRMVRLFNQRALGAATQAKRLAQEARNFLWQEQAEEVERRCRQALGQQ